MKKTIILLAAVAVAATLSACGGAQDTPQPPTEPAVSTTAPVTETTVAPQPAGFKEGVWNAETDGVVTGTYYFSESRTECKYHSADGVGGIPFDYEIGEDGYIFHMGGAEDNTAATVTFADAEHATVVWQDGRTENLAYLARSRESDR